METALLEFQNHSIGVGYWVYIRYLQRPAGWWTPRIREEKLTSFGPLYSAFAFFTFLILLLFIILFNKWKMKERVENLKRLKRSVWKHFKMYFICCCRYCHHNKIWYKLKIPNIYFPQEVFTLLYLVLRGEISLPFRSLNLSQDYLLLTKDSALATN